MKNNRLVSYCLFTYNQETYIKEAILAALNQTYSPLEIVISDDCSTDSTFQAVTRTVKEYKGPHRIVLNRNKKNLGLGGNFSKVCYSIATGDYLVTVAGDDISKKNHVEQAVFYMEKYDDVSMLDFNAEIINEEGVIVGNNPLTFERKKFSVDDYLKLKRVQSFAPGRIIKRNLLTAFNPISNDCPTEDSILVLRSLLKGGFYRINEQLVYYRKHNNSLSSKKSLANISNSKIVEQYRQDILHYYDCGLINKKQFRLFLGRVKLEYNLRELKYRECSNKAQLAKKIIFIKLLKMLYKFKFTYMS